MNKIKKWPRIISSEMEYPIRVQTVYNNSWRIAEIHEVYKVRHNTSYDVGYLLDSNGFCNPGGRIYVDRSILEIALPEEDSLDGIVASEINADEIVLKACNRSVIELDGIKNIAINRRVIDLSNNTGGYHENYSSLPWLLDVDNYESNLAPLAAHLASRSIYCGAGAFITATTGIQRFVLAQKLFGLETDFSGSTVQNKPLINTRREPHADNTKYARIHITSGDPNLSPWATKMKFATTSIVLTCIENRIFDRPEYACPSPNFEWHEVAQIYASDPSLSCTASFNSSKLQMTALNLQEWLIEAARQAEEEGLLHCEESAWLDIWEDSISTLAKDPSILSNRIEWLIKQSWVNKRLGDCDSASDPETLQRQIDQNWDLLGGGAGHKLKKSDKWKEWMPPQELIDSRLTTPPETRALGRTALANSFIEQGLSPKIEWSRIRNKGEEFYFSDPYSPEYTQ